MKKILFTLVDLNIGGVQKTLVSILNNFDYTKFCVDLMVLKKNKYELEPLLPKEVHILYLEDYVNISFKNNLLYRIKKNINIKSILKLYRGKIPLSYDVAISFNGFNNYADLIVPVIDAKKKIIWVHNDFYNVVKYSKSPFIYRKMYHLMGRKFDCFDKIVVVCKEVFDTFNILYDYQYKDKMIVINNYINQDEIIEKSNEENNYAFSKYFNIVSVGRLCKAKNFQMLVSLLKRLNHEGYRVMVYLIGDGEKRKELETLVLENNLTNQFIFLGSKINPYSFIKKASLFVSTSLYESYANTIIESLMLGIKVVSTDTAGARNIKQNIALEGTCLIGQNEDEIFKLIVEQIKNKKKTPSLDYSKYNKKVMSAIYEMLS